MYLVEDDDALRAATAQSLELAGLPLRCFTRADSALKAIPAGEAGVIVSDIRMPGMDGLEFLRAAMRIDAQLPVILVTGHGDVPMAVGALKDGAFYSSQGPELRDVRLEGDQITVESSAVVSVIALGSGSAARAVHGHSMTRTTVPIQRLDNSPWVRVAVVDAAGKRAWSNPLWREAK